MDFLGNEITPGSIILMSGTRSSGFSYGVVKKVGRGRVQLTSNWPSRKDNDNVIVISEEQLIQGITASWMSRANENGMYVTQRYTGRRDENNRPIHETVETPIQDKIREQCAKYIRQSREIKGEPLGEYAPTLEELANQ
jgi:hypothetical protein